MIQSCLTSFRIHLLLVFVMLGVAQPEAQTVINTDSAAAFIHESWHELNKELYSKVIAGELTPFLNDSLTSQYEPREIEFLSSHDYVLNLSDSLRSIDSFVSVILDPTTDFLGSRLYFKAKPNMSLGSTTFEHLAYAPVYLKTINWSEIGLLNAFVVDAKALEKLPENSFFNSLINQRMILGDYRLHSEHSFRKEAWALQLISNNYSGDKYVQNCFADEDTTLAEYNLQLLTSLAKQHALKGLTLYKDRALTTPYDSSFDDLQLEHVSPWGDIGMYDKTTLVPFEFETQYDVEVTAIDSDYVVGLMISENWKKHGVVGVKESRRVYYSFNLLSKYLETSDEVVLRKMMAFFTD